MNNQNKKNDLDDSFYADYLNDNSQDENDYYSELFSSDENVEISDNVEGNDDQKLKRIFPIIVGCALLTIILSIGAIIFFNREDPNAPKIELLKDNITLKVGESSSINYNIVNSKVGIKASFKSLDSNIATVDNNGNVTGKGVGKTKIIVSYKSNGKDKEEKCNVSITN